MVYIMEMNTIFIVVSPPEWMDVELLYAFLIKECGLNIGKCVKEFGKEGSHPHLNWIATNPPSYEVVMEKLEQYVRTQRYPCGKRRRMTASLRQHLLVYKEAYDTDRLERYIAKEAQHEVLHDLSYEVIEWEFEYKERKKFDEECLHNIDKWLYNHPIAKRSLLFSDYESFDAEVRKMMSSTGGIDRLFKWTRLRWDTRDAIYQTLKTQSGLKTRKRYYNDAIPSSLFENV